MEFSILRDPPWHLWEKHLVIILITDFTYTRFIIHAYIIVGLGIELLTIVYPLGWLDWEPTIGIPIYIIGLDSCCIHNVVRWWMDNYSSPSCSPCLHLTLVFSSHPLMVRPNFVKAILGDGWVGVGEVIVTWHGVEYQATSWLFVFRLISHVTYLWAKFYVSLTLGVVTQVKMVV